MKQLQIENVLLSKLACALLAVGMSADSDLVWRDNPRAWHQQIARIVDHRFTAFDELARAARRGRCCVSVARDARAGAKTAACPGCALTPRGLQLCDHINGTVPAADGTVDAWQALVAELRPMRFMWWTNMDYWSAGPVWPRAAPRLRTWARGSRGTRATPTSVGTQPVRRAGLVGLGQSRGRDVGARELGQRGVRRIPRRRDGELVDAQPRRRRPSRLHRLLPASARTTARSGKLQVAGDGGTGRVARHHARGARANRRPSSRARRTAPGPR